MINATAVLGDAPVHAHYAEFTYFSSLLITYTPTLLLGISGAHHHVLPC